MAELGVQLKQCKTKRPLRGQSFFVYLKRRVINENNLQKSIESLGGKVDKFFSNDVTCLLVDDDYGSQGSGLESLMSPLAPSCTTSPFNNENSPSLQSPVLNSMNEKTSLSAFSRGYVLLQRSKSNAGQKPMIELKQKCSFIERAQQMGVKIKKISAFMEWLNAEMTKRRIALDRYRSSTTVKNEVTNLSGPTIKVEDVARKYRPQYKVFTEEPRLFFENCYCESPFDSLPTQQNLVTTNKPYSSHYVPETKSVADGRPSKMKYKEKRLYFRKPQRNQYCECCKVFFHSLSHHINSERHQQFTQDLSNYDCIKALLKKLPSVQKFVSLNQQDNQNN